ncbi:ABC transporter permease [Labrys monachus]|uniref:ABC-2 type transport system permease protein n=1 Tax=Labrys monachus TaxID=217067 RepID=A0ABU0F8D9_9HYPH|nr:ABC transporter permease [Labrys monachus]MDQ0390883.1 ABC-2 type transport system permease protein [Labrys monachus]
MLLVILRELRWMRRDRLALVLAIGIPVVAFAILAAIFSNAVIRDLRVTVVDSDHSPTSLIYVQAVASAPSVTVAERSGDMTSAMHAIRSGDAIAAVYIPPNFERDLVARKRPQIVVLYNQQYFTPGSNAATAISNALTAATATLTVADRSYAPGSLVVEEYVLTNPALNYGQFLLRSILPTVLHVIVAIAAGYAVGSEFSRRSRRAWLRVAGGSPLTALVGKLAPLFAIFVIMTVVEAGIIHGFYGAPFRGDSLLMGAAACLLVIAYLSLGSLLQLLTRNLALGMSVTAIFCNPAFGFAGVGFPVLAMGGFARFWGTLLPLRWYIQILFDQAVRGLPTSVSAQPFLALGGLAVGLFGLAWWRLRILARTAAPHAATRPRIGPSVQGRGMGAAMVAELQRILNDRGVFGLIVLAPVIYGVLYPQPYLAQVLRSIPIVVVDQDHTELSRDLVEALNADEAVAVAARANTLAEAQAALDRRQVFAILAIPEGTEREILKGNKARLAAYVDSAYFLLYDRTLQGIVEASGTVTAAVAAHGARSDGSLAHAALIRSSPVELLSQPLFNPTGGYASYVVPAAFLLILQQTLLLGGATMGGVAFEQGGTEGWRRRANARAIIGQALAHLCLAVPGFALYLIILPRFYGFSTLGGLVDLVLMAVPFVLSVSFLAQFVSLWFRRRETAVLLFIAVSLPLFFMVGVSWPVEAIPAALRAASRIFPSTSAIDGLVRINQMGATLRDVSRDWAALWILSAVYCLLAVAAARMLSRGITGNER